MTAPRQEAAPPADDQPTQIAHVWPADLHRSGLVPLSILARYELVNLADESTWTDTVAATGRTVPPLALGAVCRRPHYDDADDPDEGTRRGYIQVLAVTADGGGLTNLSSNLAQLAAVCWEHEDEAHPDTLCTCRHSAGADDQVHTETDPGCLHHGDPAMHEQGLQRAAGLLHDIGIECGWTQQELRRPFEVTWDDITDRAMSAIALLAAVRERIAAHADADIIDPGMAALELTGDLRALLGLDETRAIRDVLAHPEKPRCEIVVPAGPDRERIGKRLGLNADQLDGYDWRCYLAPHSVNPHSHTVRPEAGGHMDTYLTETETTP